MARKTGTITQLEVRNLNPSERDAALENKHRALIDEHGYGVFATTIEPNGDISWTFDHADTFSGEAPAKSHLTSGLTPEQVEAVYHARSLLCTKAHVKLGPDGVYTSDIDPKDDPAIPKLMETINTLEAMCVEHGKPSVPA